MTAATLTATPWHSVSGEAVMIALDSRGGLTAAEVEARRRKYGRNELPEPKRRGVALTFVRQFLNPLIYLLLAAAGVSVVIGEARDATFIFAVLLVNAAVGTIQESKAERGTAALRRMMRQTATVDRDGERTVLDASELVPGDFVWIEPGMRVPADLRLISSEGLVVDESLLTGESTPVAKDARLEFAPETGLADRRNMLWSGTMALAGRASGIVVATGLQSEIGRIAESLVATPKPSPPLIAKLDRFTRVLGLWVIVAVAAVSVPFLFEGMALDDVFFVAVALAVSAIPEGLPVAITVALAIATARMARRHVIVRSLPAVEGLGACTVIASDKTGTLTRNVLTLRRVFLPRAGLVPDIDHLDRRDFAGGEEVRRLARTGVLANEAQASTANAQVSYTGDTVDVAILAFGRGLGLEAGMVRDASPAIATIPFEAELRYSATFCIEDGKTIAHVKGAAEAVIPMCGRSNGRDIAAEADRMAADGYRVLALASGEVSAVTAESLQRLTFLGLIGLIDPLRPEAAEAVYRCRQAGIQARMVTGDHPATAFAIARDLGIAERPEHVVTGRELERAAADDASLRDIVQRARVFARVEPRQKLSIVQMLQREGHIVAVTGDGVNDAPALRQADIGVAMGKGGTDIARDASDLVVTDDNFASIVNGVEEGRVVLDNVRKILLLLLSTGAAEILIFFLAIAMGLPLPLIAVQLLWLNLVTNGIQDVALAFEKGEGDVLKYPPRSPSEPLIDRHLFEQIVIYGGAMGVSAAGLFFWCMSHGWSEFEARNATLLLMVLYENILALVCRSETRSIFSVPVAANPLIVAGVAGTLLLHVAAMHLPWLSDVLRIAPVDIALWGAVAVMAGGLLMLTEIYKAMRRRADRRRRVSTLPQATL
jgi:P-type Ca2+ transporter type 2C